MVKRPEECPVLAEREQEKQGGLKVAVLKVAGLVSHRASGIATT